MNALAHVMLESNRERFELFQMPSKEYSVEEMIDRVGLRDLDEPFKQERGYGNERLDPFFIQVDRFI